MSWKFPLEQEVLKVGSLCVKWSESHSVMSDSLQPHGLYSPWNSPGQNTGVGSLSLLQGNFPTQQSNPGLLLCRQIIYQLSHKGSPRILERVAYFLFSESSQPRNRTGVSCIADGFFTNWAMREAPPPPSLCVGETKIPQVEKQRMPVTQSGRGTADSSAAY